MNSVHRVKAWPGSLSKKCTHTGDTGLSLQASGSEAMRALICNPGTAFVIGVRSGSSGEITPRSVTGVKAPAGSPGNELLAGVVGFVGDVFLVVRSGLSKHVTSTRSLDSALRKSSQVSLACAENAMENRKIAVLHLRRSIVSSPNVVPASML